MNEKGFEFECKNLNLKPKFFEKKNIVSFLLFLQMLLTLATEFKFSEEIFIFRPHPVTVGFDLIRSWISFNPILPDSG